MNHAIVPALDALRLWPLVPASWRIAETADWWALDKPWGVPMHVGPDLRVLPESRPVGELLVRMRQAGL